VNFTENVQELEELKLKAAFNKLMANAI